MGIPNYIVVKGHQQQLLTPSRDEESSRKDTKLPSEHT